MEKPTLHTVAKRAGVSIATVSKVVNGVEYGIAKATSDKVQSAIEELGYRPNRAGRGLRTLRRSIIGMAIVDSSPTFLADPFITNLVAGLSNHLSDHGYGLLLHGIRPNQVKESFLVRESVVDGLCVLLSGSAMARRANMTLFSGLNQPMIVFQDKPNRLELPDTCFVNQDDFGGALTIANHIIQKNITTAFIIIPSLIWPAVSRRIRALFDVLSKDGVKIKIIRCSENSAEAVASSLSTHIDKLGLPDIIIGANDRLATSAIKLLNRLGLRIPKDVAVSGFNAFEQFGFLSTNLTSAHSPAYELGNLGGQLLLDRLNTGAFSETEYTLPVDFVPGSTV